MGIKMKNLIDIKNKVIVITGAGGIIGTQLCKDFIDAGAKIFAIDRSMDAMQNLAPFVGASLALFPADVSQLAETEASLEQALRDFGRVDALINNAATKTEDVRKFCAPVEEYSLETWREVMSVNLDGAFLMAKVYGSWMAQNGGGSIVQTASIYGVVGPDARIYEGSFYLGGKISTPPVYSASKAGLIGLTRHLATHWAKDKVRVNTIAPGGMESGQNEEFQKRYAERVPMGRMGTTQELSGAYAFFISDASSYVTGQLLCVDGGWTAW